MRIKLASFRVRDLASIARLYARFVHPDSSGLSRQRRVQTREMPARRAPTGASKGARARIESADGRRGRLFFLRKLSFVYDRSRDRGRHDFSTIISHAIDDESRIARFLSVFVIARVRKRQAHVEIRFFSKRRIDIATVRPLGIGKLMERSHATLATCRSEFAGEKVRIGRRPFDLPSSRRATPMYVIGCRHRELLIASSHTSSLRSDDFASRVRSEISVKNNKRDAPRCSAKIRAQRTRAP